MSKKPLISVENLSVDFRGGGKVTHAVRNVSFDIGEGVDWEALRTALTGAALLGMENGRFTTLNLDQAVAGSLADALRQLGQKVSATRIEKGAAGTALRELRTRVRVDDGWMVLQQPLTVNTAVGQLKLDGRIGLDWRLDLSGTARLTPEFVAPRLWFAPQTIDGGYTANSAKDRKYALDRTLRSIDIAREIGSKAIVLWLAREGSYIRESKNARVAYLRILETVNAMLDHDKEIEIWIEPKPNEPTDQAYVPTIGHAIALAVAKVLQTT